ncbi:MOSC domain-containing protein [Niveibacterium sp. 24ML]|nr:MOSC domain-containing protein [Niveibacterium sp. 24ML]
MEVNQPRVPCHKIAKRLDEPEAPAFVAASARIGWYFRVIESGIVSPGDSLQLIDRSETHPTIEQLWRTRLDPAANPALIRAWAQHPALGKAWRAKFTERAEWLARNPQLF